VVKKLVLITGAPGAGKTTLAVPLAARLDFPLMSKDAIKEALAAAIPGLPSVEWSRLLGSVTYEVMWKVAPEFESLVIECNFYPRSEMHRLKLLELGRPVEVFCSCPPDEARRRYRDRAGARHPVHIEADLSPERMAQFDRPMGVGPVLSVDTTGPVDLDMVAHWVRRSLETPHT
jgi:AAA domain